MKAGIGVRHPATDKTGEYWRVLLGASFVVLVGIAGVTPETAFAAENDYKPTVTVLVFNYSQASTGILSRAEREAGRILGEAGLRTVWLECPMGPSTAEGPCQKAAEATDVRLRVLSGPVQNELGDSVFGFTVHPVLASVYYEHAVHRAKSDDAEFEIPIILGCVIAHELGHLLLGSNRHSGAGIMRPRWESSQVRQLMKGMLLFTTEQSNQLRGGARARMGLQKREAPDPGLLSESDGWSGVGDGSPVHHSAPESKDSEAVVNASLSRSVRMPYYGRLE